MAVDFTAAAMPDSYIPQMVVVFLPPAVAVATLLVSHGAARLDPSAQHRPLDTVVFGPTKVQAAVHLLVFG